MSLANMKCCVNGCENFGSCCPDQHGRKWYCLKHFGELGKGGKIIVEKKGFFEALFGTMGWPHEVQELEPKKKSVAKYRGIPTLGLNNSSPTPLVEQTYTVILTFDPPAKKHSPKKP